MESIDKLREWARGVTNSSPDENIVSPEFVAQECGRKALLIADEIEREIAERYMELPVDAGGVPIHIGDRMRLDNGHEGEVWLIGAFDIMMSDHLCFDWAMSHHVKPRTLEDVLLDAMQYGHDDATVGERAEAQIDKYAAEIRELLGVAE